MKNFVVMVVVLFSLYPHPIRAMDPLEELAHCFHAHVKEEYQFDLKNFKEYRKEGGIKAEVVETNIKAAKYRNEWARSLKKDVKSYLQKTLTPDAFLRRLLTDRRGYLRERLNNFQLAQLEYQKTGSLLRYFFLATTPGALKAYIERSTNKEKGIDHYNTVIRIIDRYQIWNKLIVGVFKRHALKEFSSETRDYLRASVTLHPLIRGETEDWGHPDAAMLTYAGDPPGHKVDSYYFSPFGLSSDLPKVPWLELESEKKVSEASTQPPLSKSARRKQERKENPELRLKLKAEAEKYKNNASVFSKTSPLATEAKPAEAFEVALRIEPKSAEAPVVIPSSIVPSEIASAPAILVVPSRIELESEISLTPPPLKAKDKKKPSKKGARRRARAEEAARRAPTAGTEEKSFAEPMLARGTRVFHSLGVTSAEKLELVGQEQATVDAIFSSDRFQKVQYRQFKALWTRLNGKKSIQKPGSGGSHRSLRNRDGKVVGSTYAPNKNHTYGLQTIKYLRDALRAVGAHPSK